MPAAETMVFAWLGFADYGVSVRNFAFCHLCEATILTFSGQQSAVSQTYLPQRTPRTRSKRRTSSEFLFSFAPIASRCGERVLLIAISSPPTPPRLFPESFRGSATRARLKTHAAARLVPAKTWDGSVRQGNFSARSYTFYKSGFHQV